MNSIGERIRYLRKEILGKTQKEFGSQIGLKPNSVSDIESGKNSLTEQTANAICREFHVNDYWLRTGEGEPLFSKKENESDIVSELLEKDNPFYDIIKGIAKTYQKLEPKSQTVIDNFAEELLKELKKGG